MITKKNEKIIVLVFKIIQYKINFENLLEMLITALVADKRAATLMFQSNIIEYHFNSY